MKKFIKFTPILILVILILGVKHNFPLLKKLPHPQTIYLAFLGITVTLIILLHGKYRNFVEKRRRNFTNPSKIVMMMTIVTSAILLVLFLVYTGMPDKYFRGSSVTVNTKTTQEAFEKEKNTAQHFKDDDQEPTQEEVPVVDSAIVAQSNKAIADSIAEDIKQHSLVTKDYVASEKKWIADSVTKAAVEKNMQCLKAYAVKKTREMDSAAQAAISAFRTTSVKNVAMSCCEIESHNKPKFRRRPARKMSKDCPVVYTSPRRPHFTRNDY